MSDQYDMTELYLIVARQNEQLAEIAAMEARTKAVNDMLQVVFAVHAAQMTGLIYAGMFNPEFCKPKG